MEEPKPAENTAAQVTNPQPDKTETLPSQPPVQPQATAATNSKKRPLDNNAQIQDSSCYKMRLVLKDLRPHFVEVLRTPDFRNCKASLEIQEKIKKLMELYKQLTAETMSVKKCKVLPDGQQPQEVKVAEQPQPDGVSTKPSDNKSLQSNSVSTKQQTVDSDGSQIIGGSAFGWNFITFSGSEPVYYGVTKESFRSSQVNFEGS